MFNISIEWFNYLIPLFIFIFGFHIFSLKKEN